MEHQENHVNKKTATKEGNRFLFMKLRALFFEPLKKSTLLFLLSLCIVGILFLYQHIKMSRAISLYQDVQNEQKDIHQKLDKAQKDILLIHRGLAQMALLLDEQQNKSGLLSDEFLSFSRTLGTLEKLSKTDPQLLQKYSKVYFLNENYTPQRLSLIPEMYVFPEDKELQIHSDVLPHLVDLLQDAQEANLDLVVLSAYRSFNEQKGLKAKYKVLYGAVKASQFSADQGYSEHQLGTTVDFTNRQIGSDLQGFENTKEYEWLGSHAHVYGFVLSYPKGNKYYIFEPWHFRYVGKELATKLYTEGKYFYDLDQHAINQYLVRLFD